MTFQEWVAKVNKANPKRPITVSEESLTEDAWYAGQRAGRAEAEAGLKDTFEEYWAERFSAAAFTSREIAEHAFDAGHKEARAEAEGKDKEAAGSAGEDFGRAEIPP